MNKILIITQRVDKNDQLLAFFLDWLRKFSKRFDKVTVLCLEKGEFDLPGVHVISLGKDRGLPGILWRLNFYRQIFNLRSDYDSVFVHMNPIGVVAGGIPWRLMKKKIILWYTTKGVTFKLRVAEKFADIILTASKKSFRIPSKKVIITGHGIDTELFKPDHTKRKDGFNILSVGRISPVKNYDVLIDAVDIVRKKDINLKITIAGEPALDSDKEYYTELLDKIKRLNLADNFDFVGKVNHSDLAGIYQSHDLFIHMSKTGSLDKAILEAMASGMTVISSNDSSRAFLSDEYVFPENNSTILSKAIRHASVNRNNLREYVVKHHNLDRLIERISQIIHG